MIWTILGFLLDLILIGLLGSGLFYALRLTRQLADMRASRADMERFVADFNASVMRAEAGIQGLKAIARSSGDDLERLIEKGQGLRDELLFLSESADQIANRLSQTASTASQMTRTQPPLDEPTHPTSTSPATHVKAQKEQPENKTKPTSAAERDLLRVLKKLG